MRASIPAGGVGQEEVISVRLFPTFRRFVLAGLTVFALGGCAVLLEDDEPQRRRGPVACTLENRPVCAVLHGDYRTFPNACVARSEGFNIVHSGPCQRGWSRRRWHPYDY